MREHELYVKVGQALLLFDFKVCDPLRVPGYSFMNLAKHFYVFCPYLGCEQ